MKPHSVRELLDELSPESKRVVRALRAVVRECAPDAEESLLWGAISYHRPTRGGRIKGAVCSISTKLDEVRLELIHGARLPDPSRLLQGDRISKRYVPIPSVEQARQPAVAELIRQAAALDLDENGSPARGGRRRPAAVLTKIRA